MNNTYVVQDEDDSNRIITLKSSSVKRLDDSAGHLKKGDKVLAVFPETTSFYGATIMKNPKFTSGTNHWDIIVNFDDDEDNSGKIPARQVPARFVLKLDDLEK